MDVQHTDDVEIYAAAASGFLEAEPCRRNLLRTVIDAVRAGAAAQTAPPSFWWVTDDGHVAGAASWTPPHGLLVSELAPAAVAPLVASAHRRGRDLHVSVPGVITSAATGTAISVSPRDGLCQSFAEQNPVG